jgi:excisionase family DNA binding protein
VPTRLALPRRSRSLEGRLARATSVPGGQPRTRSPHHQVIRELPLLYELISKRELVVIRIGRATRIPESALERWIAQQLDERTEDARARTH